LGAIDRGASSSLLAIRSWIINFHNLPKGAKLSQRQFLEDLARKITRSIGRSGPSIENPGLTWLSVEVLMAAVADIAYTADTVAEHHR
jgi:hypothetical protein